MPKYEQHTSYHNMAYHQPIGMDEIFEYMDDRPDRKANRTLVDLIYRTLKQISGVGPYLWSKPAVQVAEAEYSPRIDRQRVAGAHCQAQGGEHRARLRYPWDL